MVKLHASDERVQLLQATDNLRIGEPRRAWAEEWHRNDLWVKHSLAFGVSRIVTDEMLVSADEQRHSGFYQEWLAELGIHHMVGAVFPADHGGVGVLGIHRPHRAGRYSEPERRKVAVLLPHLQRALRIRQLFAGTAMAESGAAAALDRLGRPVVIVNRVCKLIYANRSAEDVVRDNPEVEVSGNRLALRNAALNERLVALVQGALDAARGESTSSSGPLAVRRANRRPLTLDVAPLHPRFAAAGAMAMIFIHDPEPPVLAVDRLRELFGLTHAEAHVAAELARGLNVAEIALRRGVSRSTVRWHLKQIFAKTSTTRQAEAVAVLVHGAASFT